MTTVLRDTPTGYGLVGVVLHWAAAAAVVTALTIGLTMAEGPARVGSPLFLLHATVGVVAFALVLPLTGWLTEAAAGRAVPIPGLGTLPGLAERSRSLHEIAEGAHQALGKVLIGLLTVHVLAAVKHHVLDRDATLLRMLRPARGRPALPGPAGACYGRCRAR